MNKSKKIISLILIAILTLGLGACGAGNEASQEPALTGTIAIDGSSTVFPIIEAVAEEFSVTYPEVKVPVGVSGTGGGFEKFIAGETDISNASRPIKEKEAAAAAAAGIEYVEMQISYDGLSILVNTSNTWVESLTVAELNTIWKTDSTVKVWSDIRPEWPNETINFYAPGTDSGTFDYFTEAINGEVGAIRPDFTASEDDNVLVQGIAGDKNAMGFFGFSYYEENQDKLKLVAVDNGSGPILPSFETIADGSYAPLSRPLFIYIKKTSLERPEVVEFVKFINTVGAELIPQVGFVALNANEYEANLNLIK
jgi:phosphate transport system substrate-binding protein